MAAWESLLIFSISFFDRLKLSGPIFLARYKAFSLLFSAARAWLNADSAASSFLEATPEAAWRDAVVVGGTGMWSSNWVVDVRLVGVEAVGDGVWGWRFIGEE